MSPVININHIRWWQLAVISIVWVIFYTILLEETFDMEFKNAILESVSTNVLLGLSMFISIRGFKYYQPSGDKVFIVLIAAGVMGAAVVTADKYVFMFLADKIDEASYIDKSAYMHGAIAFLANSLVLSISLQSNQFREVQELQHKRENAIELSKQAELMQLRHQLQPHFLFNSLNSINALIFSDPEKARKMVFQLSDFLRGSIKAEQEKLVDLEQEIENIRLYLSIEEVRFGHRLATKFEVEKSALSCKVPPLILQPLLENAIKFGLYGTTGEVEIMINIKMKNSLVEVMISNPFDDDALTQHGTGFGLKSVERRLNILFSRNDLLSLNRTENLCTVTLKIPQK